MARELGAFAVRASSSPTLTQYVNLSNYAYSSGLTPPNPKLKTQLHLTPLVFDGKTVEYRDDDTGFYGEAFVTTKGTSNVIIAFQGTNPHPPNSKFGDAQIADDIGIYLGIDAPSYATALNFTQTVISDAASRGIGTGNIFLTGHSLGAAEAEYVASKTGFAGVTFGTPGIVATGRPPSRLHNYVEQGDPVGNYASDQPDYLGNIVHSGSILHYGTTTLVGPVAHSANLKKARIDYDTGHILTGAYRLAVNAFDYHPIANYAKELNLKLLGGDRSVGADVKFFDVMVCYVEGTRIRTARGDVAIEALAVGDEVETASGALRPIRWLGHRRIDCRRSARQDLVQPVRIAAGAFDPGRPARDLLVSPAHAIAVDVMGEVLIPACALLNGTTLTQEAVESVTYWHLELDSHDIVLAENLPAESYLDNSNRGFFGPDGVVDLHAWPDAATAHARFCRPYHSGGPRLEAARARLGALAAMRVAKAGSLVQSSATSSRTPGHMR